MQLHTIGRRTYSGGGAPRANRRGRGKGRHWSGSADMDGVTEERATGCPVAHGASRVGVRSNRDWWPNQLNLRILHQHSDLSNPMGRGFDYAKAFEYVASILGEGNVGSVDSK